MKSQLPFTMSLPIVIALATAIYGQALDDAAIQRASTETLLSMPEPPLGYAVTKHPLVAGDQLLGFQVQVMKEDAVSKVLIKVETRDLSDRGFRVAACKGYVDGFASELRGAGFKITAHKLPDIEKADFKTPVVVDLTFANDEGTTILFNKRMFFTTKGYDVTVLATDENDLKVLTDWATQVRPASPRP
jgi:hypothetical protein